MELKVPGARIGFEDESGREDLPIVLEVSYASMQQASPYSTHEKLD